jgi:hypothetical protein
MSSSLWITNCAAARIELQRLQRDVYAQLGLVTGPKRGGMDREQWRRYLGANPDNAERDIEQDLLSLDAELHSRPDISSPDGGSPILGERLDELKVVAQSLGYGALPNICFGTIPGGGLDSYTFKVAGTDEYAVVVPDGLFSFANLLTKVVVLLQPLTASPSGLIYGAMASIEQFSLAQHPYIVFRHGDLMRAFFLNGEPREALPYRRAVAYQERFAYLLVGFELFVLAHEVAHVLLRHFESDVNGERQELDADALALRIVIQYFKLEGVDFPMARASLCAMLFLGTIQRWERTLASVLGGGLDAHISHHAGFGARFEHFAAEMERAGIEDTPPWYIFVYNAIRIATQSMDATAALRLTSEAPLVRSLSARALPASLADRGHHRTGAKIWWLSIASLLSSSDKWERDLGLWFFLDLCPHAGIALYDGAMADDQGTSELFRSVLISLEPMYRNYMPRLRERFRETAQEDALLDYKLNITSFLAARAAVELGHDKRTGDPRWDWPH